MQCSKAYVSKWKITICLRGRRDVFLGSLHVVTFCIIRGESAFHAMMSGFGWAKNPMINRIHQLRSDIPMTLMYGSRSWVDNSKSSIIKEHRPNSFVNVQVITLCYTKSSEVDLEW